MPSYAILLNPGHNRVYYETSIKLSGAEFSIVAKNIPAEREGVELKNICGVDYATFQTISELSPSDIELISGLSFFYALFEIKHIDGELYLKPIGKVKASYVEESISTILKYTGKTNELFTRMMINVAYASQSDKDGIKLLDPVAGKGTTLYEGLIKGFDVYGIEIGEKIVNEAHRYMKKYLETAGYKHEYTSMKISGPGKSYKAQRHTINFAKTKEDYKGKLTKTFEIIAGNSLYADKFYKKNFFDIIVGDLPYGIQHGNVTNEKQSSTTRNPSELLGLCLSSWLEILKPGGCIVLSWNCNVLRRDKMEQIFTEHGLVVKNELPYTQFEHRVDQAIFRDIIVARKE